MVVEGRSFRRAISLTVIMKMLEWSEVGQLSHSFVFLLKVKEAADRDWILSRAAQGLTQAT